jgi:hypothetical protein
MIFPEIKGDERRNWKRAFEEEIRKISVWLMLGGCLFILGVILRSLI